MDVQQSMTRALPPGARLIIFPTSDLLQSLIAALLSLEFISYNLSEIGAVLTESFDRVDLHGPPGPVDRMRDGFANHFATQQATTPEERAFLYEKYDAFFAAMAERLKRTNLPAMGGTGFLGITFFDWMRHDLVVIHHPIPY